MEIDEFHSKALEMAVADYRNRYHRNPDVERFNSPQNNGFGTLIYCDDMACYHIEYDKGTKTWGMKVFVRTEFKMWRDEA